MGREAEGIEPLRPGEEQGQPIATAPVVVLTKFTKRMEPDYGAWQQNENHWV